VPYNRHGGTIAKINAAQRLKKMGVNTAKIFSPAVQLIEIS